MRRAGKHTRVQRLLLLALTLAIVGSGTELLLLGHYESTEQWIPLAAMALAVPVLLWRVLGRSSVSRRAFLMVMVALALVGMVGLVLHFQGNLAFERELHPTSSGMPLFFAAARGATPLLAPAIMIYSGLLGLIYHLVSRNHLNA